LASSVCVVGSFSAWATRHPLALAADGSTFAATLQLAPGTYQFKFVVDGSNWTTAASLPKADDGKGNVNNEIVVRA